MHLLQAIWNTNGTLSIWGEDSLKYLHLSKENLEKSTRHPFCCDTYQIRKDIDSLGFEADEEQSISIYLPTSDQIPISSPKLSISEDIVHRTNAILQIWQTSSVCLQTDNAMFFLASLPSEFPQGLKVDFSVKFWREVLKLVLELLSKGRFLPHLLHKDKSWKSFWSLLTNEEQVLARIKILCESMPPLCRAMYEPGKHSPEPFSLVESFISLGADTLIRTFLSRHSLVQDIPIENITSKTMLSYKWLQSLTSKDGIISGSEYELIRFEQQLKSWSSGYTQTNSPSKVITCFHLLTPEVDTFLNTEETKQMWELNFSLKSPLENAQELNASALWKGELENFRNSDFSQEDLEEILLTDLGKAASIFHPIKKALLNTFPTHVFLTSQEAYFFIKDASKALEQLGIEIKLPSLWKEHSINIGLRLNIDSPDSAPTSNELHKFISVSQLLNYHWDVVIGNRFLTVEEFTNLISTHSNLINVDGEWIELQANKVEATLSFLREQKAKKVSLIEALKMSCSKEISKDVLPIVQLNTSGWLERFLNPRKYPLPDMDEPKSFFGSLRPYQKQGLAWLSLLMNAGISSCLADDMGLGKTIQLIALLLHEREQMEANSPLPTLLVVPMSILANWQHECSIFAPSLKLYLHHGTSRLQGKELIDKASKVDLFVTTYSIVTRDEAILSQIKFSRIVLDEAQNIKNIETKQTQALKRLSRKCSLSEFPMPSCHRLALTGTPLENHLDELWSIFDFLIPGLLGGLQDFRRNFSIPIERYRDKQSAQNLARIIQPFVLRRLKNDPQIISDLPEKIEMLVYTSLTDEQSALYQKTLEQMLPQVSQAEGIHRKGLVLSTITKLKQICNHPSLFLKEQNNIKDRSGKLQRLEELLEELLAESDKALIFTQYAQMGALLRPYLQDRFDTEVLFLHGGLNKLARDKMIEKFQSPDGPSIFLLSLKAGGFGLNLTQANQVIHFDQWWNPAVQEQATDRAYRIGQKRSVQVRKFICQGTLEEKIHEMLNVKKDLAETIVGSTKNMVLQLSTEDLHEMLKLSL